MEPMFANLATVMVGLIAGFLIFIWRRNYVDQRTRKRLIDALHTEVGLISAMTDKDIETLKLRIQNGEVPFTTADMSHTIFNAHQSELSLLDKPTLAAVIKAYASDRTLTKSLLRFQDKDFQELEVERKMTLFKALRDRNESHKQCRDEAADLLSAHD